MKPGDFYVGVIDFFSILLPGALLAGMLAILIPLPPALEPLLAPDAAKWVAFALASYALGHFLLPVAAQLDPLYDAFRDRRWRDFREAGKPFSEAEELRKTQLGTEDENLPMNTLEWSTSILMLRAPVALAEVERYEANSKFFRSMAMVLPVLGIASLCHGLRLVMPASIVLALASLWVFATLRFKSSQLAYRYVIVLDRLGELERRRSETKKDAEPGAQPE